MIATLIFGGAILLGIGALTLLFFAVTRISSAREATGANERKRDAQQPKHDERTRQVHNQIAVIRCSRIPPSIPVRFAESGYSDCRVRDAIFGGNNACAHGCLGAGSCVDLCPNNAITMVNGTIAINDYCNGCGYCLDACPRHLIELVSLIDRNGVRCAAASKQDPYQGCPASADNYLIKY